MNEEEAQKVLDELQAVNPKLLNKQGKRLYNAIMKIADERDWCKDSLVECKEANNQCYKVIQELKQDIDQLKRQIQIKDEYLDLMISIGFDYDGLDGSIDGLKSIVDQLVDYAKKAIDNDDKTAIYGGFDDTPKNILLEELNNKHIPRID